MSFINRNIKALLILLLIAVILLIVYGFLNKRKKQAQVEELYRLIDGEIGANGKDIKALVDKVAIDEAFLKEKASNGLTKASNSAKIIYEAFLWKDPLTKAYWPRVDDDEEAVKRTLQIKTKGQVKAVMMTFGKEYGQELDDFLRKYNSDQELNEYYTIVSKLKP